MLPEASAFKLFLSTYVVMFLKVSILDIEFVKSSLSSRRFDVATCHASPSTATLPAAADDTAFVAANCKLETMSEIPMTSSAAALSPTTSTPLNFPSLTNGDG